MFGIGTSLSNGKQSFEMMSKSTNGGKNWSQFAPVVGPVTQPGVTDPVQGRPVIDGVAGARSDLAPAPSVDIANGAPTGTDATNRMVMSYVSGDITTPHVYFSESTNGGASWAAPRAVETSRRPRPVRGAGDLAERHRRVRRLQRVHDPVPDDDVHGPAPLVGVVLHADSSSAAGDSDRRVHGAAPGRAWGSPRLERECAHGRVPRRLRVRDSVAANTVPRSGTTPGTPPTAR